MIPKQRDVFLMPGGLVFGGDVLRLHTLLGSCVSVVAWHPRLRLGGMCHYLLPQRANRLTSAPSDGRYAPEALQLLYTQMSRSVTDVREYQLHLFGGSDIFDTPSGSQTASIGQANIAAAHTWLAQHGLTLLQSDVGGQASRRLSLDVATGNIKQMSDRPVASAPTHSGWALQPRRSAGLSHPSTRN